MQLIYSRAHLDLEHVTYRLIHSTMSTIEEEVRIVFITRRLP